MSKHPVTDAIIAGPKLDDPSTLKQPTVFKAEPRSKAHDRCGEIEDELIGLDHALDALETRLEAVLIAPDTDKDASPFVSTNLDERQVRIRDRVRHLTDAVLNLCERCDA